MVRRSYTPEQIIGRLREAEVRLSQGLSVGEVSRKIGITEQTYCRAGVRNMVACGWNRLSG